MKNGSYSRGWTALGYSSVLVATLLSTPACLLDGKGRAVVRPPTISVQPNLVCSGERAEVTWLGPSFEDGTPVCEDVYVSNTGGGNTVGPFEGEPSGSFGREFTRDTTVQISESCGLEFDPTEDTDREDTVRVIDPGEERGVTRAFYPGCPRGGGPVFWSDIRLGDEFSQCIEIVAVHNVSGYTLDMETGDSRTARLANGDTDTTNLVGAAVTLSATPVFGFDECPPGMDDRVVSPGSLPTSVPPMRIVITARCDTSLPGC